jgi:phosphoesterase RecJ-like protein
MIKQAAGTGMMNNLEEIAKEILNRDQYTLIGHVIPDGDCIGSLLAMRLGLRALNKEAQVVLQDAMPEIYGFLEGSDCINKPRDISAIKGNVIFLDCSDLERAGQNIAELLGQELFAINIDHHADNKEYAHLNYVDPRSAATAEIVYRLLKIMQVDLTPAMATALYTGIVQDTGGFRHASTTSTTMRIAADLLDCGVNMGQTKTNLFESRSIQEIMLLRLALQNIALIPTVA